MRNKDFPFRTVDALMQHLGQHYDTLSPQQQRIARYLESHRTMLALDRINDIATACAVQPSGVVRFAQRLGFSGFSQLQSLFRASYQTPAIPSYSQRIQQLLDEEHSDPDKRDDAPSHPSRLDAGLIARHFILASQQGLAELEAQIDQLPLQAAVDLLLHANTIYVVGVRRMFPVAAYVAYALQHTQKHVQLISGLGGMFHEQVRAVQAADVLIAISFQPYGHETRYCARVSRRAGAKLLVVTDSSFSPLVGQADCCLRVREGEAFAFRSLTSTLCLCQALFVALASRLAIDIEEAAHPPHGAGYEV